MKGWEAGRLEGSEAGKQVVPPCDNLRFYGSFLSKSPVAYSARVPAGEALARRKQTCEFLRILEIPSEKKGLKAV